MTYRRHVVMTITTNIENLHDDWYDLTSSTFLLVESLFWLAPMSVYRFVWIQFSIWNNSIMVIRPVKPTMLEVSRNSLHMMIKNNKLLSGQQVHQSTTPKTTSSSNSSTTMIMTASASPTQQPQHLQWPTRATGIHPSRQSYPQQISIPPTIGCRRSLWSENLAWKLGGFKAVHSIHHQNHLSVCYNIIHIYIFDVSGLLH